MAILPYLLIAAILVWQFVMSAAVVNAAENAARNGARVGAGGGGGAQVARDSLPPWLQRGAQVRGGGTRMEVCVGVPVLVPGVSLEGLSLCRDAEFAPESSPFGALP
jgi:hypothetical protein